jgi:hypothetical protein
VKVLERAPKGVWSDSPLAAPKVPKGYRTAREWSQEWGICYRAASSKLLDWAQKGRCEVLRAPQPCGMLGLVREVYLYRPTTKEEA